MTWGRWRSPPRRSRGTPCTSGRSQSSTKSPAENGTISAFHHPTEGAEDMKRQLSASVIVAVVASVSLATGQSKVTAPSNKYTPAQDVQLGREAAQEVEQ